MTNSNIDSLMASEVMGWTQPYKDCNYMNGEEPMYTPEFYTPTTDMNQAMECAEVMVANGYTIELRLSKLEGLGLSVLVRIGSKLIRIHFEHLKEAPLAICKAVLKAKGIEWTA